MDRLRTEGVDVDKTYCQDELAKGNELVFAASGVTKGELLDGVRFIPEGAIVNSLCMRLPSGTVEKSETTLRFRGHPVYKDSCPRMYLTAHTVETRARNHRQMVQWHGRKNNDSALWLQIPGQRIHGSANP